MSTPLTPSTPTETCEALVVTAAAGDDAISLLALLGSLTLNWLDHPPVLVYDLGLDAGTLASLATNAVRVQPTALPARYRHSRDNWALFCLNHAPGLDVLWLDARTVVLNPLDEVFEALRNTGHFLTCDPRILDRDVSDELCRSCGLSPDDRNVLPLLATTVIGFRKAGRSGAALQEAFDRTFGNDGGVHGGATHGIARKILSLLAARHHWHVDLADSGMYTSRLSPEEMRGQKIWVHRRKLLKTDALHLSKHLSQPGPAYQPMPPFTLAQAQAIESAFAAFHYFIRERRTEAGAHLRDALTRDAGFMTSSRLGSILDGYRRVGIDQGQRAAGQAFVWWAVAIIKDARGRRVARRVLSAVQALEGIEHFQSNDAESGCRLLFRSCCTHPAFAFAHRREILQTLSRAVVSERRIPSSAGLSPNRTR